MTNLAVEFLNSVVEMFVNFGDIAMRDPFSALLIAVGGLIFTVAFGAFAALTVGAVVDGIIPDSIGREPPQQGQ